MNVIPKGLGVPQRVSIEATIGTGNSGGVHSWWFALCASARLRFQRGLMTNTELLCDGCGQQASSEHIAKRLQRLEWTTRYRPVHIGTVLLGAFAPTDDVAFLYAAPKTGGFLREGENALTASGISQDGKSAEATLAEFQRGGYLLTYVLECPLNAGTDNPAAVQALLRSRLPALLARIRRSLRPKRVVPISSLLEPLLGSISESVLNCGVVLNEGKPFDLDIRGSELLAARLREA